MVAQTIGMVQTNLREIDADMNVDDVADYIERHGATAWLIGIGGIQAQYPTELPFHSKNALITQRKSADLVLDAITAAHSRGMRLLARIDFSKVSAKVATEHPEWLYKSPLGKKQEHTGGPGVGLPKRGLLSRSNLRHPRGGDEAV